MNITTFAQYAGVSKAAVSRYFNGGYLSAEKRAQIAAAVEATGYRPSMQAQMLRTRRTRQIGVIMPRLSSESCARMVEGISRVLDDQNYQLLLINTANDNTREVRALDTLRHDTVDGIILIATMFTPEHHAVLQSLHVPVVIVGQQYPGFSCVFHDDFGAAQAATAHMLQKGRRKPGYLGVTLLDKAVGLARREGFDSALRDAGLVPQPQRMSIAKFNMESGYHQAEQLFGRAPGLDCLFCATDSIALGALQYCRNHSLRVPEDIMIAAVGDNRIGRVAYVPLTSAHLHYRTAGDKAARLLLEAWFPGEQGGTAIAKTLFGNAAPGGRLPITFPRSVGQIPCHYSRRPGGGKRYVEMDWLPLYPFGYGLTYTTFAYRDMTLSRSVIGPQDTVTVSVTVTNTGKYTGDAVPQLYVRDMFSSVVKPERQLAAFRRLTLAPGESRRVELTVGPKQLRTLGPDYVWRVEPGKFELQLGDNAENILLRADLTVE